uniref:Chloride channel protein n=1 Tax=Eptatretus burgeri TaxID=7764 RepID=A0A8C4WZL5_EPTBU
MWHFDLSKFSKRLAVSGSGIPELKTILGGVVLQEHLSLRTFFAKSVGLTCVLSCGSTIFLGKVGPFVHISSILATFLGRIMARLGGTHEDMSRQYEMLVAAAAVGVGCCFGAPVTGVLFSIEVMSTHFAVRDYWRGFFSASCGALIFRLLAVSDSQQETITALFKTNFRIDFPYDLPELLFFAFLGLICGLVSWACLQSQQKFILLIKRIPLTSCLLTKQKTVYSALAAFLLATTTYPKGLGCLLAARLSMKELLNTLFDHQTWGLLSVNNSTTMGGLQPDDLWREWGDAPGGMYAAFTAFLTIKFLLLIIAMTIPVPAGYFMPMFIYGAVLGRLVGELLALAFPAGISTEGMAAYITPGAYALAGAAAFSGAITHTISTAMLVFELTGQITHILPVLIAVLLANGVSQRLQPSFYDSAIIMKKLPFLPRLGGKGHNGAHGILVEYFMDKDVVPLPSGASQAQLNQLFCSARCSVYPVVNSAENLMLVGSVKRKELAECFIRLHKQKPESLTSSGLSDWCHIEPITAQLSPKSSLYQAHRMFELLGLQQLFVTSSGQLRGVVTLRELRKAIEDLANGVIIPYVHIHS